MLFGRRFKFNKDRSTGPGKVKIWRNYMRKNYILDTNILISSPNAISASRTIMFILPQQHFRSLIN